MHTDSKPLQIPAFHGNFHAKYPKFWQVRLYLRLIVFAGLIAGCIPVDVRNSTPTSIANCFPTSVFSVQDMQARVDCHPNDYKLRISKDTVVLFAFPDSIIDWVGPIFIIHVPSVSEVVVETDGSLFIKDYKSPEGQAAIESVLNNRELMTTILERASQIQQGTLVPPTVVK